MTAPDQRQQLKREAHEWVARLTSGRATETDADAVKRWSGQSSDHARALAEATLLWQTLAPVSRTLAGEDEASAYLGLPAVPAKRFGRRAVLGGALAASAAAVVYLAAKPPLELWPSLSDLRADYRTGTGERRRISMNDGVSVELNTRSSVNVGTGDMSQIELVSGETSVSTGQVLARPLVVVAGGGRVTATNAQFNLRCEGATTVTCVQGSIRVEHGNREEALSERQQISYGPDGMSQVVGIDPRVVTAWREGRLVFPGVPLSQVVDEVNRYRTGRIILMNVELGRRLVEASFPLHRTDELVTLVTEAYGARATVLPGGIVLLS